MKKIIISLAVIGIVAGITLGITGAFWTDQGVSENQSFVSGNLNLRLSNDGTSGSWDDNVTQTWDVQNMTPGGTPYVSTLYMKNNGSVNADYLKFTLKNTPTPGGMDKKMRITQLDYAGKSLLTGGAGTNVAPTDCDIKVGHRNSESEPNYWFGGLADKWHIQEAIDIASPDQTICVASGTYNEDVFILPDKDGLQLIGAGSDETFITSDKPVVLRGWSIPAGPPLDSFRIQGFTLKTTSAAYAFLAGSGTNNGTTYTTNLELEDVVVDGGTYGIGLNAVDEATFTNVHISNISGGGQGALELTGVSNLTFTGGSIEGNAIGVRLQPTGAGQVGAGYGPNGNIQIHESSLIGNTIAIENQTNVLIDATNNWWGDFDPSDQVSSDVDYSPYAGGPFIGFINGSDYNGNGFADLDDFEHSMIVVGNPDLLPNSATYHTLKMGVQLDGPTTGNTFMGGTVGMDMTVTMGQGSTQ